MAILDLFKKKDPFADLKNQPEPKMQHTIMKPRAPSPGEIPITQVSQLQSQGLTNNQIVQTLQRQGYQPTQIYDALAQSEAKQNIEPYSPEPQQKQPPENYENYLQPPEQPPSILPPKRTQMQHPDSEALVEQIVEEKWSLIQKELSKITEWKNEINSKTDKLEQNITDIRSDLEGLHKAILSRVNDYDKTLMDVGTEIKAMEKVFQDVLPELTSNVQELSRVTKGIKSKQ
ncbi:hypothetical protein COV18_04230 [Candidatus Woesearchaeota archaeon CG10_big_fil_rev_8_21_14_0_10_37_12]|nr:MAG: hypothetical protein COV18_04230 [Candidatus Woesearchaeota archaeon CG10_big_fil_rev_8_21_14_0_10_37_12]